MCPTCGIRLDRGEEQDYFNGGMLVNIILTFAFFGFALLVFLIVVWPNVPWDTLQYFLAGAMLVLPILLYPFSRVIWLAVDLAVRPRSEKES